MQSSPPSSWKIGEQFYQASGDLEFSPDSGRLSQMKREGEIFPHFCWGQKWLKYSIQNSCFD